MLSLAPAITSFGEEHGRGVYHITTNVIAYGFVISIHTSSRFYSDFATLAQQCGSSHNFPSLSKWASSSAPSTLRARAGPLGNWIAILCNDAEIKPAVHHFLNIPLAISIPEGLERGGAKDEVDAGFSVWGLFFGLIELFCGLWTMLVFGSDKSLEKERSRTVSFNLKLTRRLSQTGATRKASVVKGGDDGASGRKRAVSFDTKLEQRLQETGSMRTSTIANLDEGGGGAKGDNNKEGGIKPVIPTQSAEELFNVMSPVITNQGKYLPFIVPPSGVSSFSSSGPPSSPSITINLSSKFSRILHDVTGDYEVFFDKKLTGVLKDGCFSSLKGVLARKLPLTSKAKVINMVLPKVGEKKIIFSAKLSILPAVNLPIECEHFSTTDAWGDAVGCE